MGDQSSHDDLPSLLKKSHIYDHDTRFENRNSEDVHRDALAAAKAERDRVRKIATEALELHEMEVERLKLRQKTAQDAERLRLETEHAMELVRIRDLENKQRSIPKPAPRVPTPPPRSPTPPPLPVEKPKPASPPPAPPKPPVQAPQPPPSAQQPQPTASKSLFHQQQNPFAKPQASAPTPQPQPEAPEPAKAPQPSQPTQTTTTTAQTPALVSPDIDRYLDIHRNLKQMRAFILEAGKQDKALKTKTGDMRRAIRQSLGQLTGEKGANKTPMGKILEILREALNGYNSPPYDPSLVMVSKPEPSPGATNNGDTLPILFIYLLNLFSKLIISQFIVEAGALPEKADPIGVIAISIFSRPEFHWRSHSLIPILICKLRVVCPVLFGVRGSEETEQGRTRLGWKKENGQWIGDQPHTTRMTGLGSGYASICLRDFSGAKSLVNPWPPTEYWQAVARITATPAEQMSPTQFVVLRAMIEHYEVKFLQFYGNAAVAALRIALVEFPGRATVKSVAVGGLQVLADKLERDWGLKLK